MGVQVVCVKPQLGHASPNALKCDGRVNPLIQARLTAWQQCQPLVAPAAVAAWSQAPQPCRSPPPGSPPRSCFLRATCLRAPVSCRCSPFAPRQQIHCLPPLIRRLHPAAARSQPRRPWRRRGHGPPSAGPSQCCPGSSSPARPLRPERPRQHRGRSPSRRSHEAGCVWHGRPGGRSDGSPTSCTPSSQRYMRLLCTSQPALLWRWVLPRPRQNRWPLAAASHLTYGQGRSQGCKWRPHFPQMCPWRQAIGAAAPPRRRLEALRRNDGPCSRKAHKPSPLQCCWLVRRRKQCRLHRNAPPYSWKAMSVNPPAAPLPASNP
mmetsp:Transcript_14848/g.41036  ORF Transcript_14848/g.41036 Transcript_14848/m.41036 type:complete len:320 (-) Transcript_14848:337-1296(-)